MDKDSLPASAREIAELIGLENTATLMRHFGGTYLDIPKNARNASILNAVLPQDAVTKLCNVYSGERISYIPNIRPNYAARDSEIARLSGKMTLRATARQYGISIARVCQIRKKHL